MIEHSVLGRLRTELGSEATRRQLQVTEADWQSSMQADPVALVGAVLERVLYDGVTGGVALTLGKSTGGQS